MFFVASLIVIVTPGQDMVLVMSRSLSQGQLRGSRQLRASVSGWSGTPSSRPSAWARCFGRQTTARVGQLSVFTQASMVIRSAFSMAGLSATSKCGLVVEKDAP
jgi:hypothetical protein